MSVSKKRVCVIGAGPSGMSILFHFNKLKKEGKEIPDIVCFEKQDNFGGLWNYSWRTGLDGQGDPIHGSMYRYLWSNGPKEALEFPEYTFEEHFGKAIPSFPPREVLFDYLQGRWQKDDLKPFIRLNHMVRDVQYNESTDNFTVVVKNKVEDKVLAPETFDYVIVAIGHFSTPHVPYFTGIEKFPGRVMHSHDLRDSCEFKGKRVLLVGSSYSAEDICMQVVKYGAASVINTWRTKPLSFKFPSQIEQRPLLQKIQGQTCHFKDGSTADIDAIILCTGYLYCYNFLPEELRLYSANVLYPPNLYKGVVFLKGGNNKCLYIGTQDQYYTYTMFDAEARWAAKYIVGDITLPDQQTMVKDAEKWVERNESLKDCHEEIDFQTDYVMDLAKESDYGYNLDVGYMFHTWEHQKQDSILTYRDQSFASKYTGTQSPVHHSTFMEALDDSLQTYLSVKS